MGFIFYGIEKKLASELLKKLFVVKYLKIKYCLVMGTFFLQLIIQRSQLK